MGRGEKKERKGKEKEDGVVRSATLLQGIGAQSETSCCGTRVRDLAANPGKPMTQEPRIQDRGGERVVLTLNDESL